MRSKTKQEYRPPGLYSLAYLSLDAQTGHTFPPVVSLWQECLPYLPVAT